MTIQELESRLFDLRQMERHHIQQHMLVDQIDRAAKELESAEIDHQALKEAVSELKGKRTGAVSQSLAGIITVMGQVMPDPMRPVVEIGADGKVNMGIEPGIPYAGLSGGQRRIFEAALAEAMLFNQDNGVFIIEAGELDGRNLDLLLKQLMESNGQSQVIVNTCHAPAEVPDGWTVIGLDGEEWLSKKEVLK